MGKEERKDGESERVREKEARWRIFFVGKMT